MKCLVLAAGYATRLYPLTENFPKPLLKVGAKTILDWLLDDIRGAVDSQGRPMVDGYIIVSNHKYVRYFEAWSKEKPYEVTVVDDGTKTNEARLGAVKDIQFAIDALKLDIDMLVIAGDKVLDFSLTGFMEYAQRRHVSCIMRYYEPDRNKIKRSGMVTVDADDRVLRMAEKPAEPDSPWCCPRFTILRGKTAIELPRAFPCVVERTLRAVLFRGFAA